MLRCKIHIPFQGDWASNDRGNQMLRSLQVVRNYSVAGTRVIFQDYGDAFEKLKYTV